MFCNQCGAQVADGTKYCPSCGQPVDLGAGTPVAPAPPWVPPSNVEVRIGYWIGEGWKIVKADMFTFVIISLLYLVVSGIVPIILQGAMTAGMHIACMVVILRGKAEIGDVFKGFNYFVPTLVACILVSLFTFIGFLLCIIPGFVVIAMYFFVYMFIVDRRMDFWPAMEASHSIVKQNYLGFTLLLLAFMGLHIVGLLACIVGILVTIPIQYAALTVAYRDIVGFHRTSID